MRKVGAAKMRLARGGAALAIKPKSRTPQPAAQVVAQCAILEQAIGGRDALVAALLGLGSSLAPWLAVARQSVADGLKTLD